LRLSENAHLPFDHLDKLGIFNRLTALSNIEGPISMRPAVLLKAAFSRTA
jgi:hypothetical protein